MPEVRIVSVAEVRPLRGRVLRPQAPDQVVWPGDDDPEVFHLAAFRDGAVVGVASLYPRPHPHAGAAGDWQLRGMAVNPELQRSGVGGALIDAMLAEVQKRGGRRLWCNARTSAVDFYRRHGLVKAGGEFEVAGVGPHFVMHREVSPASSPGPGRQN